MNNDKCWYIKVWRAILQNHSFVELEFAEEKVTCFNCPLDDCVEPCPFGCDQDFDEDLDEYKDSD